MEDEKDIVERLNKEAEALYLICNCDVEVVLEDPIACDGCRRKLLMWEAAHEIEELRSLIDAMKER